MPAMGRGAGTFVAFAGVAVVAFGALFASIVVTAGLSSSMSAKAAGDALVWMGAGQLVAVAGFLAAFGWLARRLTGVGPPWWAHVLLGLGLLAMVACLFVLAMVMMNR